MILCVSVSLWPILGASQPVERLLPLAANATRVGVFARSRTVFSVLPAPALLTAVPAARCGLTISRPARHSN